MDVTYSLPTFSPDDITRLKPAMKVGILATINQQGQPHLTLITTLMAAGERQVVFGQFIEGQSKVHVQKNPRTGFLIMTLDKHLWRGKADFTHTAYNGPDYDFYNSTPLFRYNAYFGVHTVYYLDLLAHTGRHPLPMNRIIFAAVQTMLARAFAPRTPVEVMNPWTRSFFAKIDNLKFLGAIGADGYPVIIPLIQAQPSDRSHLIFSTGVYREELERIPPGSRVAVFGMALTMEDVLVRGTYLGARRLGGVCCGQVELDWVYNSMPPKPMQIYPREELVPVRVFR